MVNKNGGSQKLRDIEDIGGILGAIFKKDDVLPSQIVKDNVHSDLKSVKSSGGDYVVEIPNLPVLTLRNYSKIRCGGGGIVFQCFSKEIGRLSYALKVTRPSLLEGRYEKAGDELGRAIDEYVAHAPLSHLNVARVFGAGKLALSHRTLPGIKLELRPLLMEWIENATPLVNYLLHCQGGWRNIVEIIAQSFDGIHHLHSHAVIHWDLKSDNVLINHEETPKVTDIGNARRNDLPFSSLAYSSRQNLPPKLLRQRKRKKTKQSESSRRTPVDVPSKHWDTPWLDLWMFARELNRLFAADKDVLKMDAEEKIESPSASQRREFLCRFFNESDDEASYVLKYIRQILRRLLAPKEPTEDACYKDARSVARDLRKLNSEFGAAQPVQELHAIPQHVLRLPSSGNAAFSPRVEVIFNGLLLERAKRHLQLGSIVQVYPGGSHRRSEHIVGVVSTVAEYVRALFADRTEPFWRLVIEESDIDALLLAAMLHDIGHMAFGHALEEMKGLFRDNSHEKYVLHLLEESYKKDDMINSDRECLRRILTDMWGLNVLQLETFLKRIRNILFPPPRPPVSKKNPLLLPEACDWMKIRILHSIINSAIDADKLDYLLRDSHHCGVKYAQGVDTERFYQSLTTIMTSDSPEEYDFTIGVSEKGILPVESMLIARHQMFASVYWQHTARALTAMLQYAVQQFTGKNKKLASANLSKLCTVFRIEDDTIALKWLRGQLENKGSPVLTDICDALLGDRRKLYWPAFELRYEREQGHAQAIQQRLMQLVDDCIQETNPAASVKAYDALRKRITDGLSAKLKGKVKFKPGEVLIDIPPPGMDQVEGVWIEFSGERRPIQDLSPMADAVSNAFQHWSRRYRIFLSPSAWRKLEMLGLEKDAVHKLFWEVLVNLSRELDPQQQMKFK